MGSGLSQEKDTQQQSQVSPTLPDSQPRENLHTRTRATTTSTQSNNLPHEYEAILKDADTAVDGVFLNKNNKKYLVDKVSHDNCFFLFAKELSITWGEDNRYWHWPNIKDTSEVVVAIAEMLNVCWLEVHGKFDITKLTPGIKYEIVFVVMLKDPCYGWEVPINIRLVLPDGNKQEHKENLLEKPRSKWFEIPVGEFTVERKNGGFLEFSLYEYEGGAWKKGLLVKGAAIRPKI